MRDQFNADGITLENALAYWIHRVYQADRNELFREFREHGIELTPEQWIVLVRLWNQDGQTQTELGQATFRDRPTMSRILDVMETRGLVERQTDHGNARAWRVHLTSQGRALRKKLVPGARHLVERSQRGISEEALATTRATLIQMFANLTQG